MEFLQNFTRRKLIIIGSSALVSLIIISVLIASMYNTTMVPMYANLTPEDNNTIAVKLQAMGVKFESSADGTQILVPVDNVLNLRMKFAQEGIPSAGAIVGYELFDKSDMLGTSQFVNNINLVRALEGEISRTIGSLAPIENAKVHLVIPKKELFSKIGSETSASVVLKISKGYKLNKKEINGIANFVATAVPELKLDHITILDQYGTPLKIIGDTENDMSNNSSSLEYQRNIENKFKDSIIDMLERYVGVGKVSVNVSAIIDFDRAVTSSEIFDPESQVIRSKKTSDEKESDTIPLNNISVANNVPNVPQEVQQRNNIKNKFKTDDITNYEISKTVTNTVSENGQIKKLSIAVLVDGIYIHDNITGNKIYKERSEEELKKLKSIIEAAAGTDETRGDRVEIASLKFANLDIMDQEEEKILNWIKYDTKSILKIIAILIVLVIAAILIFKPLISKIKGYIIKDSTQESMKMMQSEIKSEEDNVDDINNFNGINQNNLKSEMNKYNANGTSNTVKSIDALKIGAENKYAELLKHLNSSVSKNENNTLSVIRKWLYSSTTKTGNY